MGTFAIQMAKRVYGATVTGVASTKILEMVKSWKSDNMIDNTTTDYTRNGETVDIIYDVPAKIIDSHGKKALSARGIYVTNNPRNSKRHLLQLIKSKFTNNQVKMITADESAETTVPFNRHSSKRV
ncbi:MAG: hypothetical protein ACFFFG_14210 [Candidatus Thorarchaeota archaeon]